MLLSMNCFLMPLTKRQKHWLHEWGLWLSHFHIHNNDGSWDIHSPQDSGTIPMAEFLREVLKVCPTLPLPWKAWKQSHLFGDRVIIALVVTKLQFVWIRYKEDPLRREWIEKRHPK